MNAKKITGSNVADKATNEVPVVANATSGKSVVSSFRYFDKMCFGTLKNGVSGIIGDTTSCSLRDMLALKGSGINVLYTENGVWTDKAGKTHPKYRLEWSLE